MPFFDDTTRPGEVPLTERVTHWAVALLVAATAAVIAAFAAVVAVIFVATVQGGEAAAWRSMNIGLPLALFIGAVTFGVVVWKYRKLFAQ